jgi:hypothetical protein
MTNAARIYHSDNISANIDFSTGVRGQFYQADATLNVPGFSEIGVLP